MAGEDQRSGDLLASTYDELRRMAAAYLRSERRDHTLQPTALVHEAWCRLASHPGTPPLERESFVAQAALVMRRVLVDHARARRAEKRGGTMQRMTIDIGSLVDPHERGYRSEDVDLLDLDAALDRLRALSPEQASLVECRFFGGLTLEEVGALLGIRRRTVDREWACAQAWLYHALEGAPKERS